MVRALVSCARKVWGIRLFGTQWHGICATSLKIWWTIFRGMWI
ncbi:hypothetical protein HMPREF1861_02031 [Corynebacterium kroppenstedtii]|nr:hypothetical protein HMPREF1861_02031 [Corynebacterium kroppenstedtii]